MWKMYLQNIKSGSTGDYWDASWAEQGAFVSDIENNRVCENQGVIWRFLDAKLDPSRLFLEGGCGCANWVRYFTNRGYQTLGIDFAERTVERVKSIVPNIDIRVGNVAEIPLEDGSVHCYYSGGVVEHFENGPDRALAEARRVLARDGWFFCSVPDASTLRTRLVWPLDALRSERGGTVVRSVPVMQSDAPPDGYEFFQYLFGKDEFIGHLRRNGFEVQETTCYSLLWGLMEFPGVGPIVSRLSQSRGTRSEQAVATAAPSSTDSSTQNVDSRSSSPRGGKLRSLLERVLLKEDVDTPLVGPALGLALEHCANMRLYVARPC
jgi:SAM-dependent methyltransferase